MFSRLLKTYLILSVLVGSFWKSNRTLCKCIAAPGTWETNLNIIVLCHKINAKRNKAFYIVVINHFQMGDLMGGMDISRCDWQFSNIKERKICRVLVYTDLPSIHQNSSPKPVRWNEENADFNRNIEKNLKLKKILCFI